MYTILFIGGCWFVLGMLLRQMQWLMHHGGSSCAGWHVRFWLNLLGESLIGSIAITGVLVLCMHGDYLVIPVAIGLLLLGLASNALRLHIRPYSPFTCSM